MYIGVDIGGSKILVVAGDHTYKVLRSQKMPTPKDGAQGMMELIHLIEEVAAGEPIQGIGVAAAAINVDTGAIMQTSPNMHGWRGIEIVAPLKNHFHVPVNADNDASAAGLTEAVMGAGKGMPFVLYVTISTGIGASLIINKDSYHGAHSIEAGHIIIDPKGPLCGCGGYGHFESMCSGKAIIRDYGKAGYEITDPKTWDSIAKTMAMGFHNLIESYSPSVVVIGGGVGVHYLKYHDFLIKHLKELTPMYELPPILASEHIETAVAYGALIIAERAYRASGKHAQLFTK